MSIRMSSSSSTMIMKMEDLTQTARKSSSSHSTLLLSLVAITLFPSLTSATPLQPTFTSCLNDYLPIASGASRLNVSNIYANLVSGEQSAALNLNGAGYDVLRVDLIGQVGQEVIGYDNTTGKLATLFTTTSIASFTEYTSTTWLCNSLFPATLPEPYSPDNITYCPLAAGNFAVNLSIPLYNTHALSTLHTQVRVVDTNVPAQTLTCIDVRFSPYNEDAWYYRLFLWFPASLAIAFWVTTWTARLMAGWVIGGDITGGADSSALGRREARMRKWGTMIISGLSGERLNVSGALLRFVTPSLRDIIGQIQFVTSLGMIAVSWPAFFYPIVSQSAWADLVWNVTLTQSANEHISPYATNTTLPSDFSGLISNPSIPLYLDLNSFNPLLNLYASSDGMESFANMIGIRSQDLFGICLSIFLILTGIVVLISLTLWLTHALTEYASTPRNQVSVIGNRTSLGSHSRASLPTHSRTSSNGKEWFDPINATEIGTLSTQNNRSSSNHRRIWMRFKPKGEAGAFHFSAFYGNLLRLILMFHLPITTFSIYQLTLGNRASIVSRVFAALAFSFISVLIPSFIMFKISRTPTGKLYDAARTLLALGPMYNVYEQEKQMFRFIPLAASLVSGIVLGGGQGSGLAQTVVILVVELVLLISPTIWLPWGEGASMGAPTALIGIIRVVTMVLVMLLSPEIALTEPVIDWITYVILILQAIIFVFLFFMILTKIVEGIVRLFGGALFDESRHPLDGGLFAAIMDLDCLNPVRGGKAAARRRRKRGSRQLQRNVSAAGSLTTQQILDSHSLGVQREADPKITPLYPSLIDPESEAAQRGTYFPVIPMSPSGTAASPTNGPAPILHYATLAIAGPDRVSSEDSRSEERSEGHILDAWKPGSTTPGSPTVRYSGQPGGGYLSSDRSTPVYGYQPPQGTYYNPYFALSNPPGAQSPQQYPNPYQPAPSPPPQTRMSTPPSIRVAPGEEQRVKPSHNRTKSSSGIVGIMERQGDTSSNTSPLASPQLGGPSTALLPSTNSGLRPDNRGLRPTALAIPKRRSLNNMRDESPTSQHSPGRGNSPGVSGNGTTRSKHTKAKSRNNWFSRDKSDQQRQLEEDEDESDDEPGPSKALRSRSGGGNKRKSERREPAPFEPVPIVIDDEEEEGVGMDNTNRRRGGWRSLLGLEKRYNIDEDAERARDENMARKVAAVNESGALLAGVGSGIGAGVGSERGGGVGGKGSGGSNGSVKAAVMIKGRPGRVTMNSKVATSNHSMTEPTPNSTQHSFVVHRKSRQNNPAIDQVTDPITSNPPGVIVSGDSGSRSLSQGLTTLSPHTNALPASSSSSSRSPVESKDAPRSFVVKRPGGRQLPTQQSSPLQQSPSPQRQSQHQQSMGISAVTDPTSSRASTPLSSSNAPQISTQQPVRSFRVIRPNSSQLPTPTSSFNQQQQQQNSNSTSPNGQSFIMNRPTSINSYIGSGSLPISQPPNLAPVVGSEDPNVGPAAADVMGYPPSSFVPIGREGRGSFDSTTSGGGHGLDAPMRPMKNPRRSSEDTR